ncbi:DegT/DnrJ/EryC1/StrS family aminotransferase [Paenibacillus durus]|uniref:Pyridoxal phosphate-dependent aminotransferase n=1 Tax=Paenibacillus durus TaxID=44251 RepID=A0A089J0T5_PAEDU|nr:aminotransferase class I/II-fold pyridoxal phosphate-dependent enzyme [Paenibacillus durus]AIQ14804.1 pyridoxal phosphate-dependent aminotransferase [Paenibacillus durus]
MIERPRIFLSSPHMSGLEQQYIAEAFETNWVAPLGKNVDSFETELAEYVGSAGAVALSSGTAAIHLALVLLGVGSGDIVFCSSLTFVASANPILYQGALPVLIDSEPESWNMSPEALERALREYSSKGNKPKAIIVVNLYGQSADYARLNQICDEYEVPIIEDAAESLGAVCNGKMSGRFGKLGVFSFNGNKIITTSGGGMLVSDNLALLEKARFYATQARDHARHYQHSEMGYNYRLSNILAGIGRGQLQVLEERISRKREIFENYRKALFPISGVRIMPEAAYGRSTRWLTAMTLEPGSVAASVTDIIVHLEGFNVESRPVWKPLHLQPLFKDVKYYSHQQDLDVSRHLFENGICLPSDTNMKEKDQKFIIDQLAQLLQGI